MSEEWDAGEAAARAVGDLADDSDPEPSGGPSPDGGDTAVGDPSPDGSAGTTSTARSALASLFTADERGPTAETFQRYDVDPGVALIGDGVTDWLLDVAGQDVGDSLGPAGKMALGVSRLGPAEHADDGGDDDAPAGAGEVDAV